MKKTVFNILLLTFVSLLLFSCKGGDGDMVTTEMGFSFKRCTRHDSAPKAKVGDVLYGQMKIMLNNKQVLSSSYGAPERLFLIQDAKVGSIDEFLLTLHLGDSAMMVAPADSVAKYLKGVEYKPTDRIYFYMTVSQIISKKELTGHEKEIADRQQQEDNDLSDYVLRKFSRAEKMPSGLYYCNISEGTGKKVEWGKTIRVNYSVRDTLGKLYDTNVKDIAREGGIYRESVAYQPFEFVMGDDAVIPGWSEGLSYMKAGGRSKLVVPSKLAYGETGFRMIPAYTPLVFDITVVSVKD